jgi:hypothetical protein
MVNPRAQVRTPDRLDSAHTASNLDHVGVLQGKVECFLIVLNSYVIRKGFSGSVASLVVTLHYYEPE